MLRSYTSTNSNASSVQLMEPGTFSSLTKLDIPPIYVYSKLTATIHAFALYLEGFFMGLEVLRAVLIRAEGFWRVSTLRWGVTVTTR